MSICFVVGLGRRGNVEVGVENVREGEGSSNTDHRGQSEHKTHHDASEVGCENSIDDDEDVLVFQGAEAQVDSSWEEPDEHVEVEEEGRPSGRLMFGD